MNNMEKDWNSDPYQGFLEWAENHKYSDKTIKVYSSIFNVYLNYLKKCKIDFKDVSKVIIGEFVKSLNINDKSKKMYLWLISDIYNDMVSHGEMDDNPAEYVLKTLRKNDRSKGKKRIPLALTESEFIKLVEHLNGFKDGYAYLRRKCAILIMVGSGLRVEETCSLKVNDLHLEEKNPYIRVIGKFNKERIAPVPNMLVDVLDELRGMQGDVAKQSIYLLASATKGERYTSMGLYKLVRKTLKEAGIIKTRMSPHILRHTFATRNLAAGVPLSTVKLWLGHESIASTAIYEHVALAIDVKATWSDSKRTSLEEQNLAEALEHEE